MEVKQTICDGKCQADFDVKLAVKRVAYFQTVCPDFIIVLYIATFFHGYKSGAITENYENSN